MVQNIQCGARNHNATIEMIRPVIVETAIMFSTLLLVLSRVSSMLLTSFSVGQIVSHYALDLVPGQSSIPHTPALTRHQRSCLSETQGCTTCCLPLDVQTLYLP